LHTSTIVSFKWSGKSEVGNFDVEVGAEENVLRLQVSVSDASLVNMVNTFDHLTEVVPSQPFSKLSGFYEVVAHLAASCQLQYDIDDGFFPTVVVMYNSFLGLRQDVYNESVVQSRKHIDFIRNQLYCFFLLGYAAISLEHNLYRYIFSSL